MNSDFIVIQKIVVANELPRGKPRSIYPRQNKKTGI